MKEILNHSKELISLQYFDVWARNNHMDNYEHFKGIKDLTSLEDLRFRLEFEGDLLLTSSQFLWYIRFP